MYGMNAQVANDIGEALITGQNLTQFSLFATLPRDMKNQILSMVTVISVASSMEEAGRTISALALVSTELNRRFNDPQFCLRLIKHLASRFNISDEDAAKVLSLKEAKNRLTNQQRFTKLIWAPSYKYWQIPSAAFDEVLILIQSGTVDVNFTVNNMWGSRETPKFCTPLHVAISANRDCLEIIKFVHMLIKSGANPTLSCDGVTPLEYATKWSNKCPGTVKVIENAIKTRR
jgi:hypothetical protein